MVVDRPTATQRRLDELRTRVVACAACPRLVEWRTEVAAKRPPSHATEEYWCRPLPGWGDAAARLVVVGLAPAAHGGNRTGRMFTGDRSGDFLVAGLFRHGFASHPTTTARDDGLRLLDAYFTAPVRCAPPANRPLPEERRRCIGFLAEELELLGRARVYLALGAYALESLRTLPALKDGERGRFAHGAEFSCKPAGGAGGRRTIVCSYHPSQRNVFTGLLTAEMFSDVLVRVRQLLDS